MRNTAPQNKKYGAKVANIQVITKLYLREIFPKFRLYTKLERPGRGAGRSGYVSV